MCCAETITPSRARACARVWVTLPHDRLWWRSEGRSASARLSPGRFQSAVIGVSGGWLGPRSRGLPKGGGELTGRSAIRLLGPLVEAGGLRLLAHALAQRRGAVCVDDGLLSQEGVEADDFRPAKGIRCSANPLPRSGLLEQSAAGDAGRPRFLQSCAPAPHP